MTRNASARLAGFMFLFYIATALPAALLFNRATAGTGFAAKLASVAEHAPLMRASVVFTLITFVDAVLLGIGLYGLTRDEDPELALFALVCRAAEGTINAISVAVPVGLLWAAGASARAAPSDPADANTIAASLLAYGNWSTNISAACFAVGSTVFSYLLLRARTIPIWLAWVGVIGSLMLVVMLPAQLAGYVAGVGTQLVWIPVAVFA